jgi:hypothetical protein
MSYPTSETLDDIGAPVIENFRAVPTYIAFSVCVVMRSDVTWNTTFESIWISITTYLIHNRKPHLQENDVVRQLTTETMVVYVIRSASAPRESPRLALARSANPVSAGYPIKTAMERETIDAFDAIMMLFIRRSI